MTNPYIELLKKCDDTYTNLGEYYVFTDDDKMNVPEIEDYIESTDDIYDMLKEIAKNKFPNEIYFQSVGSEVRGEKVKLPYVMGSMTECHEGELENWIEKDKSYIQSNKLDGVSALLIYQNGNLKIAYSRGDGIEGQDITRHVKKFAPNKINEEIDIAIRGEIIVPKQDIQNMIDELYDETKYRYKNGRNTCSGQLNAKNCANAFTKYAHFVAYHIENWKESEEEMFLKLMSLGVEVTQAQKVLGEQITEEYAINEVKNVKKNYIYECDGIIFTKNFKKESDLGYDTGTLNPKCSRKFKIGAIDNIGETIVEDIEWNISKDAIFKPRVKVKPIDIQGVTINWVTGHNYKNIIDNGIGIGSKILIFRRGDVIPHIEKVINPIFENYNLPNYSHVDKNGVELELDYSKCISEELKDEVEIQKIIYFCSKLGIDFAGEGNIRRIIKNCLENNGIEQLIETDIERYQGEIGVNGIKFYGSLHKKLKEVDICEFMDAVGAFGRGIGQKKLQKVIDKYNTLDVTYEQLMETDGFAEISSQQYIDNLDYYHQWMEYMNNIGYPIKVKEKNIISNECSNINICFTGIRDKDLEEVIKGKGGKICSSVTKVCNILVAKDPNSGSTKLKKAIDNGVEVISLEEAWNRYGN